MQNAPSLYLWGKPQNAAWQVQLQPVPGPLKLVRMASPAEGPAAYNSVLTLSVFLHQFVICRWQNFSAPERDGIPGGFMHVGVLGR